MTGKMHARVVLGLVIDVDDGASDGVGGTERGEEARAAVSGVLANEVPRIAETLGEELRARGAACDQVSVGLQWLAEPPSVAEAPVALRLPGSAKT